MTKDNKTLHTREPIGQPFPSRWPQGYNEQTWKNIITKKIHKRSTALEWLVKNTKNLSLYCRSVYYPESQCLSFFTSARAPVTVIRCQLYCPKFQPLSLVVNSTTLSSVTVTRGQYCYPEPQYMSLEASINTLSYSNCQNMSVLILWDIVSDSRPLSWVSALVTRDQYTTLSPSTCH